MLIALIMEAANTFSKSVNSYETTRRNNPEDGHLHTRHRENLESQSDIAMFQIGQTLQLLCVCVMLRLGYQVNSSCLILNSFV
jgi:hypothetical protein